LAKVGEGKTRAKFGKGRIIFSQGDPADAVYHVQKGKIELRVASQQGKQAVVAILGPGSIFGQGCPCRSVGAHSDCRGQLRISLTRLEKAAMIRVLYDEEVLPELFISHLPHYNIRAEEDLVDQLFNSSEKRLARLLLLLAHFGKEGKPEAIIPKSARKAWLR
jgi:CRP/FNR family cyclic AMP-dependent transcriptional regulator